MTKLEKVFIGVTLAISVAFSVFSYSFVDLNLTLTQNTQALNLINSLQQIAYYNRPLSTTIFVALLSVSFFFFTINLFLFFKSKLSFKYLVISTTLATIILMFSYPFLSYDIFNYMFDAKIISHYHLSPYTHKPLDFASDDWLRFMRWVHRYSPYGPLWLLMSLVPYAAGLGKFITTLFAFKIFIGTFHLINTFLIHKILQSGDKKFQLFATSFYALNPLFLIEGVTNAHNDVVLTAFVLLSVNYLATTNKFKSLVGIFVGALIKYISILLLPYIIASSFVKRLNKAEFYIYYSLLVLAFFTFIFSSFNVTVPFVSSGATQTQFQPWYLFWTIPLISLLRSKILYILALGLSIGALLRYIPFIYYGDWSHSGSVEFMTMILPVPTILATILYLKLHRWLSKIF